MKLQIARAALLLCVGWTAVFSAQATPSWLFGELLNANGTVDGDPKAKRGSFESGLENIGRADFESSAVGPVTSSLGITFVGMSLTGTLVPFNSTCCGISSSTSVGRFDTTDPAAGGNFWDARRDFTLTMSAPIQAFGFYATDLGDFGAQLSIELYQFASSGTASETYVVPHSKSTTASLTDPTQIQGTTGSRSLIFAGFTDSVLSYEKIVFKVTQVNDMTAFLDYFGFDDMTIGSPKQTPPPPNGAPEPGSLALVALSLLGLAAVGRRRRA